MKSGIITSALLAFTLALPGAALAAEPADGGSSGGTESIKSKLVPGCSDASKDKVANGVRENIEEEVAKGEEAIKPPAQVADLSCLDGLMELPLDKFSGIGSILGDLQGGFDVDIGGMLGDESLDQMVCSFAQEKWNELTEPLDGLFDDVGNLTDKIDIGSIADGIDLGNGGGRAKVNRPTTNPPPPTAPGGTTPVTPTNPTPVTPTSPTPVAPTSPTPLPFQNVFN